MDIVAKLRFLVERSPAVDKKVREIHRIRNWAEDLQRDIEPRGLGNVENPDTATDKVWISMSSRRGRGDLSQAITRSLRRHNLLGDATVTVDKATPDSLVHQR